MKGSKYTPPDGAHWWQRRWVTVTLWLVMAVVTLGAGVATAIAMTRHTATAADLVTTTVKGQVVTLAGGRKVIRVAAKTVTTHGRTILIPAHTIALTRTQYVTSNGTVILSAPPRTVTGPSGTKTVFTTSTVSVPVTITGPGSTVTVTLPASTVISTVTGPGTTITEPGTTETITIPTTVTSTVTETTTETATS